MNIIVMVISQKFYIFRICEWLFIVLLILCRCGMVQEMMVIMIIVQVLQKVMWLWVVVSWVLWVQQLIGVRVCMKFYIFVLRKVIIVVFMVYSVIVWFGQLWWWWLMVLKVNSIMVKNGSGFSVENIELSYSQQLGMLIQKQWWLVLMMLLISVMVMIMQSYFLIILWLILVIFISMKVRIVFMISFYMFFIYRCIIYYQQNLL